MTLILSCISGFSSSLQQLALSQLHTVSLAKKLCLNLQFDRAVDAVILSWVGSWLDGCFGSAWCC